MDVDVYDVSIHGWANSNAGQQVAYLQMFIMPDLLQFLCREAYPKDSKLQKMTYDIFCSKGEECVPSPSDCMGRRSRPLKTKYK
jgi:hypothetical protein